MLRRLLTRMSETIDIEVEETSRPNPVAKDETHPSTTVGVSAREQKLLGFNPEHVIGDAFNLVRVATILRASVHV